METARNCIQRQEELVGGRGAGVGLLHAADPGAPLASEPAARHQPCPECELSAARAITGG